MPFPLYPPMLTARNRFRHAAHCGLALAALWTAGSACESRGALTAPMDAAPDFAALPDLASPSPLLATYSDCAAALFAEGIKPQDFSSQAAFAAAWKTSWAAPQISSGSLAFGPHPLSADWWEDYSPASTLDQPGDVLICARVRLTAQSSDPVDDNSFELTLRNPDGAMYETSGMVLLIEGNASFVDLRTRATADAWVRYDRQPLTIQSGSETTFELLLFGRGSHFTAEVKNTATGQITQLHASAPTLLPGGHITLLGWRSRAGILVDKLVFGAPSPTAAARLLPAVMP